MKKLLLAIIIVSAFFQYTYSQNYTRSVGLRGGSSTEILYRSYSRNDHAYQFLFNVRRDNMRFTALKLQFEPFQQAKTEHLWFGYGFGGHLGYSYTDEVKFFFQRYRFDEKALAPVLGFDGYLTVEYRLTDLPLIIGADYKPYFEFSTRQYFGLHPGEIGFTVEIQF